MKINVLDAGLKFRSGHHFDYALKLVKHLTQNRHDVHIYGHVGMDDDVVGELKPWCSGLSKLLSAYQYATLDERDFYAGELVQYRRDSGILAAELQSVRSADLWIWPNIRPQQLNACGTLRVSAPMVGCVYWDPGVEYGSLEAMLWRDALLAAKEQGVRFTLASVEGELRHRFMPIMPWPPQFRVLPHPVKGQPLAEPKVALKRIGFFGHQREEKGSEFLTPLLKLLTGDGFAVTVQNSNRDWTPPCLPGVEILGYVDDVAAAISACDMIVLPYDVAQYRARGSGILVECMSLGIPVAAPFGTLPGRTIEQVGMGPLFSSTNPSVIHQTIKATEPYYGRFATNAFTVARRFSRQNGIAKFASGLLATSK